MRYIYIVAGLILIIAGAAGMTFLKPEPPLAREAVKVNGHIITDEEFRKAYEERASTSPVPPDKRKFLDDFVTREILIQEAERLGVLPDARSVRAAYRKKYYRGTEFVAFYSPAEKAIYIAADEAKANILAHELAHAVIDQFFGVAAPVKIHEILAQYVDENFEE